jgi:hypothetical protein
VFTNARVDVDSETDDHSSGYRAYYVTDGGATESLGLISASYALRATLEKMSLDQIREIHIVSIEAPATTWARRQRTQFRFMVSRCRSPGMSISSRNGFRRIRPPRPWTNKS